MDRDFERELRRFAPVWQRVSPKPPPPPPPPPPIPPPPPPWLMPRRRKPCCGQRWRGGRQ